MPPYEILPSLTDICTEQVLIMLYNSISVSATPKKRKQQHDYVSSTLNSNIRQHLINIIFQQPLHKKTFTGKCILLEMLGDCSTQTIDFSQVGSVYIDEVWHFYRTLTIGLMTNLTKLGLACNLRKLSDKKYLLDVNTSIYRVFSQMKNLRWVTLIGVGDGTLLESLGTNCIHLEYLNVNESFRVNDEAIASLLLKDPELAQGQSEDTLCLQDIQTNPCALNLKMVGVSATSVSLTGVFVLLHYVPKLESLGGPIQAGSVSSILEHLNPEDGSKVLKLNEVWETRILPYQASLLSMMSPNLTCLTCDASSLDSLYIINSISALTLKLYFRNCVIDIYNYLLGSGQILKKLIFVDHINCGLDLSWLVELTPNLEHLEATLTREDEAEVAKWHFLRVAKVTVQSSKVTLALLTHAPALTDLDITFVMEPYKETFECINDDLIISALVDGGLTQLQKLHINECALSMKGVVSLILHCPNLTYLAPLAFWHGVSPQSIYVLCKRIKERNWKLRIVKHVDWEDEHESNEHYDILHQMAACTCSGGS
ncbi:uncharacterized protein LOC125039455 isoform X2 [Penaeus chinensis]|uniref:uncharacterized protein LOC125039455 isoform X2 n=1 Tax=Penaeus chinensis TaxID=139456 RepID=UPI001FB69A31|nr:uncharacterized protein LOC125039455 isoform X2 [Penaeus chinensis]